eukprot:gi/632986843/ref/XP_007910464.1/ PREDICTED: uncharacterized protein LOC103191288 isoform X3 [Callorhinchus milii]
MESLFIIFVIFLERKPVETAVSMTVRLVNGGSSCVGTVQVYHDGQWGTVDGSGDYGWDMKAAAVVCKELGCGVALSAPGGAHFGVGSGPVVTYDVRCRGMESTLRSCQSKPWGHRYWLSHSYDVGVFCSEGVRLVNGRSPCAGTVEVYHRGQWGTVQSSGYYGQSWDMKAAAVVCKELGCGAALSAPGGAHFGRGSGPIVTYAVRCRGSESTLRECPSDPWGRYYWTHQNDAGVSCSDPLAKPIISLTPDYRVFVRGESAQISCSGNYPGSKFSLYSSDKFITSQTAPENKKTATFTLSEISAGIYWCNYSTYMGGREFVSPDSEEVHISVWVSGPLKKPIISLTSGYRVFVSGESAQISCSGNYPGSKFSLYRSDKFITSQPVPENKKTATFTLSEISAGTYWCNYSTHMGGREFISPDSEQVRISVWDPLQKPKVSLNPDFQEFARGDSVEISCSGNYPGSNFSLHGDGELLTSQAVPENNKTATFTSMEISAGNYTCKYTKVIDGREFTSPESEAAGISVIDPLQKPNISLKPDTQVFARGERAEISCTGNYPGSNFTLYRNGEFIISQTATENTYTATFTPSEITAGNYTCIYATYTDRRQFTSPESERLGIPVRVNLTWLHIEGLVAGVVTAIVITVFILGFCANKRRKQKSQREERNATTGGDSQNDVTYATVRFGTRSLPPADADIIYANLALGNRNEISRQARENDGPVYATVRV